MDTTLTLKLADFKTALGTLEDALREPRTTLARDSVIKRFEYTFELAWKTSKVLLEARFGTPVFSPKEVFRALRANQLFTDEETEALLQMTDDRNEIIHAYNEKFSNELYEKIIVRYAGLLKKIYDAIKKNTSLDS